MGETNFAVEIRKFRAPDRTDVRRIACETAFLNAGNRNLIDDDEVMADVLTKYFTDCEPDSCFVAERKGVVAGYVTGTLDVERMKGALAWNVIPIIALRIILRGTLLKHEARAFLSSIISSMMKGEFRGPDFSAEYPAMLHINITAECRGKGIGRMLIQQYLKYLKDNRCPGIHFGTLSDAARFFFEKMGFEILHRGTRSYLKYALGRDVPYYILGMKAPWSDVKS